MTGEGRLFLLLCLGVGIAAVNTGNNLLYLVLGLMLSLILLSGMLSDFVLFGVSARRELPATITAREACLAEVVLSNEKPLVPSYSLRVTEDSEGEVTSGSAFVLKVDPRDEHRVRIGLTFAQRGRVRLPAIRLETRYPFGFFAKWRRLLVEDEVIVHPAIVPVDDVLGDAGRGQLGGSTLGRRGGAEEDLGLLRDAREGDDLRSVHARKSAARGRWVVRERESLNAPHVLVVLDDRQAARPPGGGVDAALEERIARAGSLLRSLVEAGSPAFLVTRTIDPILAADRGGLSRALDALALLEGTGDEHAEYRWPPGDHPSQIRIEGPR